MNLGTCQRSILLNFCLDVIQICKFPHSFLWKINELTCMHFFRSGFLKYNSDYLTRKHLRKNRTQATADYVDSASDPEKQTGKSRYHPSEEIRASLPQNAGGSRLSPAETTRTIIEVLYCVFQSA